MLSTRRNSGLGALAFVAAAFAAMAQRNEAAAAIRLNVTGPTEAGVSRNGGRGKGNRAVQRAAAKRRNVIRFRAQTKGKVSK